MSEKARKPFIGTDTLIMHTAKTGRERRAKGKYIYGASLRLAQGLRSNAERKMLEFIMAFLF